MKRRLSIIRLLLLLGGTAGLGVSAFALHSYQVKRQAGSLVTQADRAEAEGNYASAIDYLRRYLGFRPKDTKALGRYARLLAREDVATTPRARFQAAAVLENALRRDTKRELNEERRLVIDLYFGLELYKQAQDHIEYLLEADRENSKLLGKLARCLEGLGRYKEARANYELAIRKPLQEVDNYASLANLLREHPDEVFRPSKDRKKRETTAGLARQADGLLDQFVQTNPRVVQGYLERARYRRRYPLQAGAEATRQAVEADLRHALQLAPDNADALLGLAELATDQRDSARARQFLLQALSKQTDDWRVHLALARLERAEGRTNAALSSLREGLRQMPDRLELLWERADLLVEQGDRDAAGAIALLKTKGVLQPELDYLNARLLVRERKWAEALSLLISAYSGLQGRANLASAPFTRGLVERCASLQALCYQQLGDYHRAQAVYQRMLSRTPRSMEARLGIASAHAILGRRREAEDQYRQLLALPGSPKGAWVDVARLVLQRNLGQEAPDWDEVEEALRQAEASRQRGVEAALLRADALAARGRIKPARDVLTVNLLNVTPFPVGLLRPELLAVAVAADSRPQVSLLVGLSMLEERANRPEGALVLLEEARQRYGDLAELRQARAAHWARRGGAEAAKALQELEEGLEKFSAEQRRSLRMTLAMAHTRLSQPEQSRRLWQAVAAEHPDDWASRLMLVNLALDRDDAAAEEEISGLLGELRRIEKNDGVLWRDATVRHLLAKASRGDRGQLETARRLTAEIAQRWPGWLGAALLEAQIEDLDGAPAKALKKYQEAISRGAASTHAIRRASEILFSQQRIKEGRALVAKLPRDAELSPGLDRMAALASLQSHDNASAVARAERAVARGSKNPADRLFLGQVYWAAGQLEKAEAALAQARDLDDKAPESWISLVSFLTTAGKKEKALAEVGRAEKRLSGMRGTLGLARCYEVVGQGDKAAKIYTSPEVVRSLDLAARRAAATYQMRIGKAKEATEHLRFLVKAADPKDPATLAWAKEMLAVLAALGGNHADLKAALAGLGDSTDRKSGVGISGRRTQAILLASRGNRKDRAEAIRLFEGLIDDGVDQPQDRLLLALQYADNNEWPKARKQLVLLRKMPGGDTLPILVTFASAMLRHGELDQAEQAIAQLEKLDPDNLAVVTLRAQMWHRRGRKQEAVNLLTSYATKHGKAFGQVAAVLESLQESRAAEEMYRRHAEKSPNPAALLAHATFLAKQGRLNEALDICDRAWAKAPAELVADTLLAVLESAGDDAVRARVQQQLESALRKDPRSAAVRMALANLRIVQGRYSEAERLYRELIAERRDNHLARNNLAWMLACQRDRAGEALDQIQEAIQSGGPRALLLDTQAIACLAAGKAKEAVRLLEELVLESPKEPMYHLHLAEAYAVDGNRRAALRSLQQAQREGFKADSLHPLERAAYTRLLGELGQRVSTARP